MKAIQTRFYGPTDYKGYKIKAWAEGVPAVFIPYPHELNSDDAHKAAALVLCNKYGWSTDLIGGGLPNGDTVFVFRT